MLQIMHFQVNLEGMKLDIARSHAQIDDVRLVVTKNAGNFTQRFFVVDQAVQPARDWMAKNAVSRPLNDQSQ